MVETNKKTALLFLPVRPCKLRTFKVNNNAPDLKIW